MRLGKQLMVATAALALGAGLGGCETLKPYEKEFLLDRTMSDDATAAVAPALMSAGAGRFEKLGQSEGQASGSSCPTCGG